MYSGDFCFLNDDMERDRQEPFTLFALIRQMRHQIRRAVNTRLSNMPSLSLEMVELLIVLGRNGVSSQQELAALTVKDKASISRIVKKLMDYQLLHILTSQTEDRRLKVLHLTAQGEEVCDVLNTTVREVYEFMQQQLSPGEYRLLTELLTRLSVQFALNTKNNAQ